MTLLSHTIMIVNGNSTETGSIKTVLEPAGYRLLTAGRALSALDTARNTGVDFFLTDINLPDMTGRELATTLRAEKRFQRTPIIALVDRDDIETDDLNLAAGIDGVIKRPLNMEALALYVEFYLNGGTHPQTDRRRIDAARERYAQSLVKNLEARIRELEEKNAVLRQVDRLKDDFIQLSAHELRTPLNLLTGYGRLLADDPSLKTLMAYDGDVQELITGLVEGIDRMQRSIEDILTVSRIMTQRVELNVTRVDPTAIIQRVLQEFENAIQARGITMQVEMHHAPEAMWADGGLLHMTLANLVSNAIKYTPNHGTVSLTVWQNGRQVYFSVRDTGVGIDPTNHEKIFERMHISHSIDLHMSSKTAFGGGGLGLGLAICRGIIEAHGGKIIVKSPGHNPDTLPGSEFVVLLPLVAQTGIKVTEPLSTNPSTM